MDDASAGRHSRYIDIAYELAKQVQFNQKLGCVVTKSGRILSKGYNSYLTGNHAEDCALDGRWKSEFKGAIMYVVRLRKTQRFGMSFPCENCQKKIIALGIKRVYYTDDDSKVKCWKPKDGL